MNSLLLPLLLACSGSQTIQVGAPEGGDSDAAPVDTALEQLPGDTSEDTGPDEPEETDEEISAWQAEFFRNDVIHQIEITLDDDSYRALRREGYEYAPGNVTVDGETVENVGVRLRGKIGSYREIDGKPKFKIDFSEYVPGTRHHGLHALALNNEVVDCSYLKEPIGYRVFQQLGIVGARTSFAHVEVNGENYGLYVIVEVPDGSFLNERYPDDDDGNLYDGKYLYNSDTGAYTLLDFNSGLDLRFPQEEGEDIGNADIVAISDAMDAASKQSFDEEMDPLVDWAQVHTYWAAEQWVGHLDGYQMNRNNYRVYFRPSDGRLTFVPTDFDYGFLSDGGWGVGWERPLGTMAAECFEDNTCRTAHVEAVAAMLDVVDPAALHAEFLAMKSMIATEVADDPRRECDTANVAYYQDVLEWWILNRRDQVAATWGL